MAIRHMPNLAKNVIDLKLIKSIKWKTDLDTAMPIKFLYIFIKKHTFEYSS